MRDLRQYCPRVQESCTKVQYEDDARAVRFADSTISVGSAIMSVENIVLRADGIGLRHHSVRVRGKFGVRSQRKDAVSGIKVVVIGSEGVLLDTGVNAESP
jgi:hypothetical protein